MRRRDAVAGKLLRERLARDSLLPRGVIETAIDDRRVLDAQRDENGGEDHE